MSEQRISGFEKMRVNVATFDEGAFVEKAASYATRIVTYERRWHGGTKGSAANQAAAKHALCCSLLQRLLYPCRWPKEVGAGAYEKLKLVAERIEAIEPRLDEAINRELAKLADADDTNADLEIRGPARAARPKGAAASKPTERKSRTRPASALRLDDRRAGVDRRQDVFA